jgi:hypothetical protein
MLTIFWSGIAQLPRDDRDINGPLEGLLAIQLFLDIVNKSSLQLLEFFPYLKILEMAFSDNILFIHL